MAPDLGEGLVSSQRTLGFALDQDLPRIAGAQGMEMLKVGVGFLSSWVLPRVGVGNHIYFFLSTQPLGPKPVIRSAK